MERREHWSSRIGFILAAAGSAVGLGNIWKFPYITGENGGGAFVVVYLLAIIFVGLPVMLAEIVVGRKTQRNPVGAYMSLHRGQFWKLAGYMGVLAGFLILSFYSVVGGWTLGYIFKSVATGFSFASTIKDSSSEFSNFTASPYYSILCHAVFMFLAIAIVYKGIRKGIERWSKILMPTIFVIILVLVFKGLSLKGSMEGVRYYLSPDFSKLSSRSVLIALGHAFFSLSLGMGAMITYGSYLSKNENLFKSSLMVVIIDTVIALLAGLAIFPAVFAMGFPPDAGPGLVFNILPAVFAKMTFGSFWGLLFFSLVAIAALTSAVSLLEVVTAYFVDELKMKRTLAVVIFGTFIFLLGIPSALSFGVWKHVSIAGKSFFDFVDNLASNYFLPLGGFFISVFIGWVWGVKPAVDEIRHGSANFADVHLIALLAGLKDDPSHNSDIHVVTLASLWGIFLRFISPVAVFIAFLFTIGAIRL
ncbi:MAG: sodium-dependent transporter [Spirochaetes bacterium]|nr:sodium-dependent transporter [Spirochaetota bacterium]